MSKTKNSFSSVLVQFTRLQTQILEILQGLNQAVSTSSETVTIELKTDSGEEITYTIPSFGYLESEITRLDSNINKLTGLDGSDANVRMPDGTFKKIYQSRLLVSPSRISNLKTPESFGYKNNWFFESFLSPALYIPIDVSDYIDPDADKILVKRIILNTDTEDKKEYFNTQLKGRNDITYEDLLFALQNNAITFFQDEDVSDLPISVLRYEGTFDIFKYEDISVTNSDGSISKKRKYYLDKLTYSDILSNTLDTIDLKVKDKLSTGESLFEVEILDTDNNAIVVKRLSGTDSISVGVGALRIFSEKFAVKEAQVGIGFNERQVVFFKAINPNFNLTSSEWSDGISFYSNDLTIDTTTGKKTLDQFYRTEVTDFGQQLITGAKENTITSIYGETPDAPVVDSTDFEVVKINEHKLDTNEVNNVKKKAADKVRLNSEIKEFDAAIEKKKEELTNTKFNSEAERRGVKNELDSLVREKTSKSSLYSSIVQELAVLSQDKPASLDKPKYRIRGFFDIPEPKNNENTGLQYPIQFIVEHRYIRIDGSATNTKQFEFTNANGQITRGSYSNWNVNKSEVRKKIYNDATGLYEWATEDLENPDAVNINQLDIPISKGERVEIRIKTISEAGWPVNPLMSLYSDTVTIDFPQELLTEDESSIAIQEATKEESRVQFQQELDARGLDLHLSRSFTTGDKYYAHDTESIASGFFTANGTVINLLEKIKLLETELASLKAQVEEVAGELSITILDSDGNKTAIRNGDSIDLFAGYYKDFVDALPASERKGAVISIPYKILLENSESTPLELISRLPGGIGQRLPNTVDPTGIGFGWVNETIVPADRDYTASRRYDIVPIVNNSIDPGETNTASKISSNFHQSQQLNSQYLYGRYTNVGLKSNSGDLYFDSNGEKVETRYGTYDAVNRSIFPLTPSTGTDAFVWNGPYSTLVPAGNGTAQNFCVHIDHPLLNDDLAKPFLNLQNPEITLAGYDEDDIFGNIPYTTSSEATSAFRHSYGFNIQGKSKQLNFRNNFKEITESGWDGIFPGPTTVINASYPYVLTAGSYDSALTANYILPDKYGFIDNDKYLIGKNTCGAYLYMAPQTIDQLLVDGTDVRANKFLENGDSNGIEIPILFQFRMTDYYGEGSTGIGIIGGFDQAALTQITEKSASINLIYTRTLGFDVYVRNKTPFSFDVNLTAKYRRESLSQKTDIIGKKVSKNREQIRVKKSQIKNLK